MTHLFQRKPIADLLPGDDHALKRVLGAGDLVMLAIGAVIGAGIFGAIGTAAAGQVGPHGEVIRYGAGPALVFSFILLGGACALAALCYAELASMIPQAGSAYAYSVRHAGRVGGVDHRLGPDPRIRRRQRRGRHLVGRLFQHVDSGASASICRPGSRPGIARRCSALTRPSTGCCRPRRTSQGFRSWSIFLRSGSSC